MGRDLLWCMDLSKPLYHRRRFPAEIISHCVWLYFRFCLSYRDVEETMAERGVVVTYETIRDWSQKFGGTYAKRIPDSLCNSPAQLPWRHLVERCGLVVV